MCRRLFFDENRRTLASLPGWRNLPAGRQVGRRMTSKYFVYAIKSLSRNYIYVGLTDDVERRFLEHNAGHNRSTRAYRPFRLLYSEETQGRQSARKREKYLKSGVGKEFLKTLI
jgi:putative endonuclease